MRVALLDNPSSGEEADDGGRLVATVREAGHEVTYRSLHDSGWEEAFSEGADVIVVAGGDGSLRKVFTADALASTPLLILPAGSANNIARTLGVEHDQLGLLEHAAETARVGFDLWSVRSPHGTSCCVESAGGGLFAEVLAQAVDASDDPSGADKVGFGLEVFAHTLSSSSPARWAVEIDGRRTEEELIGVEAMNVRELGANLAFAPDADPTDGLMDVTFLRPDDVPLLLEHAQARLREEPPPEVQLDVRRGRHVVLEPPRGARVHVDDVLPGWHEGASSWIEIEHAERRVDVLVAKGS